MGFCKLARTATGETVGGMRVNDTGGAFFLSRTSFKLERGPREKLGRRRDKRKRKSLAMHRDVSSLARFGHY